MIDPDEESINDFHEHH